MYYGCKLFHSVPLQLLWNHPEVTSYTKGRKWEWWSLIGREYGMKHRRFEIKQTSQTYEPLVPVVHP